jgi:DNA-binding SARP family transcriptional activator
VALIRAHLREGNRAAALRQYDAYTRLMREELSLDPSPAVCELVSGSARSPIHASRHASAALGVGRG